MVRPLKLYNHSGAPNPRRVRIFAAEKGIQLALEDVDILAGQSRTPEFDLSASYLYAAPH
jgi:glutathione S-transferase